MSTDIDKLMEQLERIHDRHSIGGTALLKAIEVIRELRKQCEAQKRELGIALAALDHQPYRNTRTLETIKRLRTFIGEKG